MRTLAWCLAFTAALFSGGCDDDSSPTAAGADPTLLRLLPAGTLVSPARITQFGGAQSNAWYRYAEASVRAAAEDRARIDAELVSAGLAQALPAPAAADFVMLPWMTAAWLRSETAHAVVDAILSFQTPTGGWSKAIDFTRGERATGQSYSSEGGWSWISTFDNGATTEELRMLGAWISANAPLQARYTDALRRGLRFISAAQFPNGCWPQIYPLEGGYHDAATFNDQTTIRILSLLTEVRDGAYAFVSASERASAGTSLDRGMGCILSTQVMVAGTRTVWAQQYDPLTLQPIAARTYEPAALSAGESAGVVDYLMSVPAGGVSVDNAVRAAVAWFELTAIHDYAYTNRMLVHAPGADPLWARLYEIGTNRPIFGDRDGSVHYDLSKISEERRLGYAWYVTSPRATLRLYETWAGK